MAKNISNFLTGTNEQTTEARVKYNFNYDWKFSKGQGYENSGSSSGTKTESVIIPNTEQAEIISGSYAKGTNGETWSDVSLPHTYNDTDTYDRYTETGSNTLNGERTMYTGTAWYEKTFYIPTEYQNKKIYIEFEAARQMAEIYVNGQAVEGRNENGFVAFGYDLTSYLQYGQENRIVVKVDNSYPYYIKDENGNNTSNNVAWSDSHWHPNYGGLYRNSYLYVVDNLHLTLPLYSFIKGQGTYVYTTDETENSAKIHVDPEIENNYDIAKTFDIKAIVKDANGNEVLTITQNNITINPGEKTTYQLSAILDNPIRWSTDYPYQYIIETQILVDSQVIDNNENSLGIRTFRITNDYGFYLNEHYLELNGWGQRTTNEWAAIGAAYPDWMQSYVIKKMKTAGANLIRWGHASAGKAQIQSSDKYGLLAIQPGVDGEGHTASCYSLYNTESYKIRAEAFRDMIIYFRNNPSIVMWEIGNQDTGLETTIQYSDIEGLQGQGSTTMANALKSVIEQYDYGNRSSDIINTGSFDETSADSDRFVTVRQSANNTKNIIDVAETTLGSQNNASNTVPRIESEYNRLEARRGVWDKYTIGFKNFTNGATETAYKDITGEDFAVSQIKSGAQSTSIYDMIKATNYTGGGANWIFSDSISHGRLSKSEVARASGEVDGMMLEKEAYWVDKVAFSKQPSSYIIGHWNYEQGTKKKIYVAAKGVQTVELFVNDISKGKVLATNNTNGYLFEFPDITYESGTIRVQGYDKDGKEVESVRSSKKTHGKPANLKITPITGVSGALANNSDVVLFDIEVVDSDGYRCITYNGQTDNDYTDFIINDNEGTSIWRGGYNSNIEYSTNKKYLYIEAGITRVAVKTTRTPGNITLSASTRNSGLTSNIATVTTKAVPDVQLDTRTVTGLSFQENELENYTLETIENPGYGDGSKLGVTTTPVVAPDASILIQNYGYTGTQLSDNGIKDAFSAGKKMYSDDEMTFTNIPLKYVNAEYLLLPMQDNQSESNVDLLSFTAKKDITILILRDERTDKPTWLDNTYTKTTDVVRGGNGIDYTIYTKQYLTGEVVKIGTTSDTSQGGVKGTANIIAFKETANIQNNQFFYEDFSNADTATIINGYNAVLNVNTDIQVDRTTFASDTKHKEVLHFTDTNTTSNGDENLAFIEKNFADLDNTFKFSFDAYVTNTSNNEFIRTFINRNKMETPSSKENILIQNYLYRTDNSNLKVQATTPQGADDIKNNISLNQWHTYTYTINPKATTYTLQVDGVDTGDIYKFYNSTSLANYFVFGTGQTRASDFYIDNIQITPKPNNFITSVKIDGNALIGFSGEVYEYNYSASNLTAETKVELTTNDYYKSHTIEFIPANGSISAQILIHAEDIYGHTYTYTIKNENTINMLEGFTVIHDNGSSLTATSVEYEGKQAIKLYDNAVSNDGWIYLYKQFEKQEGIFKFSYDINIPKNVMQNKWNRVILREGEPQSLVQTAGVGVETYLNKDSSGQKSIISARIKDTTISEYDFSLVNNPIPTGGWHKVEYLVNVTKNTYDIYIDGQIAAIDVIFRPTYSNQSIDTMVFATGGNSKSEMYFANLKIEPIYGAPIDGITIGDSKLVNFKREQEIYTYYTSEKVTETLPSISVVETNDFKEYTVERNVEKQSIIIQAKNKADEIYTYKIYFEDILQREVSVEELKKLIEETYTKYPDELQNEYVEKGWNQLRQYLKDGQELINNIQAGGIASEMKLARDYYRIEKAISQLIKYKDFDYSSANIEIVRYSEDLENLFEIKDVLENGATMYKNSSETFYSVPYKLWNAEYIAIKKDYETYNGAIQFKALVDLDVFIAYDRDGGQLHADGYLETGGIITSSEGTVYKVYQKHFDAGDIITLDFDTCIENSITKKNSIVAFLPDTQANNDSFVSANADDTTTEKLKKLWTVVTPESSVGSNSIEIVEKDGEKVLQFQSTDTTSMAYMYKKFAKLTDRFSFSFSILNPGNLTEATANRWTRTWLLKEKPINPNISANNADKANILIDAYIDNNAQYKNDQVMIMTTKDSTSTSNFIPKTKLNFNTWNTITYDVNLTNHTATVKKDDGEAIDISNNYYQYLDYINYVSFGTRKAGTTWMNFKDLKIAPITRNIINDIKIDGNTIGETTVHHGPITGESDYKEKMYYPLTKDYLYEYNIQDGKEPDNIVSIEKGTEYGETSNITQKTAQEQYAAIHLEDNTGDNYTFENRVYFELNVDKSVLTKYVDEANNLDKELYTQKSWDELLEVLSTSKTMLANTTVTQIEIDAQASWLREKIDSLIYRNEVQIDIHANLYYGNTFDCSGEQEHEISITENSSITMKTRLYKLFTNNYPYQGIEHIRKLTSSVVLPVNTKIQLMDKSNEDNICYYYYIVTQQDVNTNKKEYLLTDFIKMGTMNQHFSREPNFDEVTKIFEEEMIFVVDYGDVDVNNRLLSDEYQIGYQIQVGNAKIDMNAQSIDNTTYEIKNMNYKNELRISQSDLIVFQGEDIQIDISNLYTSLLKPITTQGKDTTIENQKMGIVLSLIKDNIEIPFPIGISALIETNRDILLENDIKESYTNSDGKIFMLYSDTVNTILNGKTLKIKQAFENVIPSGNYILKLDLIHSHDGLNYGSIVSSKTLNLEIANKANYGLKANLIEKVNPTIKKGETTILPIEIEKSSDDDKHDISAFKTTAKLLKKNTSGTYEEIDLASYVNNMSLEIIDGKLEYGLNSNNTDKNNTNNQTIHFEFLSTLDIGTYRLEFNIYHPNDLNKSLAQDIQNFIVKEK